MQLVDEMIALIDQAQDMTGDHFVVVAIVENKRVVLSDSTMPFYEMMAYDHIVTNMTLSKLDQKELISKGVALTVYTDGKVDADRFADGVTVIAA